MRKTAENRKSLFGGETEVTRDGTHPTDFGYRCMAKTFIPLLAPYINKENAEKG